MKMISICFFLIFVSFRTSNSQISNGFFGFGSFFDEKATMESILGGSFNAKLFLDGKFNQPISSSSDLSCQFDPPCRWGPLSNGSGPSWYEGRGDPAPLMWQIATGTTITAAPPFAVIPFVFQSDGAQWLTSDPINCQKPNGQLAFNYWVANQAAFKVCAIRQRDFSEVWCSKEFNKDTNPKAPGPLLASVNQQIVEPFFFAFIPLRGQLALIAIDDISYFSADICAPITTTTTKGTTSSQTNAKSAQSSAKSSKGTSPTTTSTSPSQQITNILTTASTLATSTTTTVPTTSATATSTTSPSTISVASATTFAVSTRRRTSKKVCDSLPCDFESSTCGWSLDSGDMGFQWINDFKSEIGNSWLTDVRKDLRVGRRYMGVNLSRGSSAVLASPMVIVDRLDLKLKMMIFSATHGVTMKVCYDSGFSDCETLFPMDDGYTLPVYSQWREWTSTKNLPFGGKTIYIVCSFSTLDANLAGIGIDNIEVVGC